MKATIGAQGTEEATAPSTMAVVPHEQNGGEGAQGDGADDCEPGAPSQPCGEPVLVDVDLNDRSDGDTGQEEGPVVDQRGPDVVGDGGEEGGEVVEHGELQFHRSSSIV